MKVKVTYSLRIYHYYDYICLMRFIVIHDLQFKLNHTQLRKQRNSIIDDDAHMFVFLNRQLSLINFAKLN